MDANLTNIYTRNQNSFLTTSISVRSKFSLANRFFFIVGCASPYLLEAMRLHIPTNLGTQSSVDYVVCC